MCRFNLLFNLLCNIFLMFSSILMTCLAIAGQTTEKPIALPVRYEEHRFFVEPVTNEGVKFNFFTDSGGGLFIYRKTAERLGLQITNIGGEGDKAFYVAPLPAFKPEATIPALLSREGRIPVFAPVDAQRDSYDGMLGQDWFGGRVWTFDYLKKQLLLRAPNDLPKNKPRVTLGFKTDVSGKRILNFPRIQVEIDGEMLDLLFDTGATTFLSDEALAILKDGGKAERGTSFITNSTFEKWRSKHPDWRIIEKAETTTGEAMIEVPSATIAGYKVGPIWFTRRADKNFHEFMSQFMDKRVEGAIGGNALRYFRITVDYPNAAAVFEKE